MEETELKQKILDVLKGSHLASLATIKDDRPWVRYVMTHGTDDLTLYVNTFVQSRKVAQIKADPNVHVILGADPNDMEHAYLNIAAAAEVLDDAETKKRFWSDQLKAYFSGPDDPNLVVLKITPSVIELMSPGKMQPDIYRAE
ncbi:MAG: pyridoxamine 5'-phosphate oxidase family protein [Gemmatimonadota bacterium]|nr:MAG: pyridoxamine 5'-phosphate oxidase family protein [Gemmatimonadota bacterium]